MEGHDACNSSEETHDLVFRMKLAFSCISCVTNFVAIVIVLCGGSYKRPIVRSVLYLLIANLLLVTVQVLELLPTNYISGHVDVKPGWKNVCRIFGFLDQVTAWMRDLVVVFIVVQLFIIIRRPANFREPQSERSKIVEAISVCLCFLVPFTFNWIPFLNDYYGLSGHWCWIRLVVKDCGSESVMEGLMYMLILYYCPLLVIVVITSLLCLYMVYKWCTGVKNNMTIILVILYPMVFDALCVVMFANRLDSALRVKDGVRPLYYLWVLHTIADSGRTLLPSLSVILLLTCQTSRLVLLPRCARQSLVQEEEQNENKCLIQPGKEN